MSPKIVQLLQLVRANADARSLLSDGISYSQIAMLIREAVTLELLNVDASSITLTVRGEALLREGGISKERLHGAPWISGLDRFRRVRLEEGDVFLPRRHESFF
jgi:hypothetical protein